MNPYKNKKAAEDLLSSVPQNDDFNPYDYIDQSNYKLNRRGKAQYQEDLAKLLYMAEINQENRMNEYNSPVNQAARMRAAGLNPDLNGVDNLPATNVAGYQGNPLDGVSSNGQLAGDVLGIVGSVASMAASIVSGVQSFQLSSIQGITSAVGAASDFLNLLDSDPMQVSQSDFISSLPNLSRNQRKKLQRVAQSYIDSDRGNTSYNRRQSDWRSSVGALNAAFVDPRNKDRFTEISQEEWTKIWQPYYDACADEAKRVLNEQKKTEYDAKSAVNSYNTFEAFKKPLIQVMNNMDRLGEKGVLLKGALSAIILNNLSL